MSLPSSMADFVPCDHLLQKAYYVEVPVQSVYFISVIIFPVFFFFFFILCSFKKGLASHPIQPHPSPPIKFSFKTLLKPISILKQQLASQQESKGTGTEFVLREWWNSLK